MDRELQAALEDVRDLCDGSEPDSLHVIVDAARKVANPDKVAMQAVVHRYQPEFDDPDYIDELWNAALGITEDK